jgi:four helix bundle protein
LRSKEKRGSAISRNFVECFERESKKECIHFLSIAGGSSGELRSQIYIGIGINVIDNKTGNKWIKETGEISKMLTAPIKTRKDFIKSDRTSKP